MHRYDINRHKSTNVVNIKCFSGWWCLYILGNTWATFEAKFMKKLSNTEAIRFSWEKEFFTKKYVVK